MANIFEGRDLVAESLGVNPKGLSVLRNPNQESTESNQKENVFLSDDEASQYDELIKKQNPDRGLWDTMTFWDNDDYEMTDEDSALYDKARASDSTNYRLINREENSAERNKQRMEVFEAMYDKKLKDRPDNAFSNILNPLSLLNPIDDEWVDTTRADDWNDSMRDIFRLHPDYYEKFKRGVANNEPEAINHLNDFTERYEDKYMNWRYGAGNWNESTKEEVGLANLTSGVIGDVNNSFATNYSSQTEILEEAADMVAWFGGTAATTAGSIALWGAEFVGETVPDFTAEVAGGLLGIDDKGIKEIQGSVKNETLSEFIDYARADAIDPSNEYLQRIRNADVSTTDTVAGMALDMAAIWGTGLMKIGSGVGLATARSLGSKELTLDAAHMSLSRSRSYLTSAADIGTDILVGSIPFALRTSTVEDKDFMEAWEQEVLYSAGAFGLMKGAIPVAKLAGRGVSSGLGKIAGTDSFKWTAKKTKGFQSALSSRFTKMEEMLKEKGVPIDHAKEYISSVKSGIKNLYDSTYIKMTDDLADWNNTRKILKETEGLTEKEIGEVMSAVKKGVSIDDLKAEAHGNGSVLKGARDWSNKVNNKEEIGGTLNQAQQFKIDAFETDAIPRLKKYLAKSGVGSDLFEDFTINGARKALMNTPSSAYRGAALRELDKVERFINSNLEIKTGNSRSKSSKVITTKVDKDRLFMSMMAEAKDFRSKSLLQKAGDFIKNTKVDTFESSLSNTSNWDSRMKFLTSKEFSPDKIKESKYYKNIMNTIRNKNSAHVTKLSSELTRSYKSMIADGTYTDEAMDGLFKGFLLRATRLTDERDVSQAIRQSGRTKELLINDREFTDIMGAVGKDSEGMVNKSYRSALWGVLERGKPMGKDDAYFMLGDDIVVLQKGEIADNGYTRVLNGDTSVHIKMSDLKEVPAELIAKIDAAAVNMSALTRKLDKLQKALGLMPEELMMSDGDYLRTILVGPGGRKLNDAELLKLKTILGNKGNLKKFLNSSFTVGERTASRNTHKRKFKKATDRDRLFKENGLEVFTARDPYSSVLSVAEGLTSRVADKELADSLRLIARFSDEVRLPYNKEMIEGKLESTIKGISEFTKANREVHKLFGKVVKMQESERDGFIKDIKGVNKVLGKFDDIATIKPETISHSVRSLRASVEALKLSGNKEVATKLTRLVNEMEKAMSGNISNGKFYNEKTSAKKLGIRSKASVIAKRIVFKDQIKIDEILESNMGNIKSGVSMAKTLSKANVDSLDIKELGRIKDLYKNIDEVIEELKDSKNKMVNMSDDDFSVSHLDSIKEAVERMHTLNTDIEISGLKEFFNTKFISSAKMLKAEYEYIQRETLDRISHLQNNGYERASDVIKGERGYGIKEFDELFLSPEQARGLRNMQEVIPKDWHTITKWVQFQRSLVATGDLFMTYKTMFASYQVGGVGSAVGQAKINAKALNALKDIGSKDKFSTLDEIVGKKEFIDDMNKASGYTGLKHHDFAMMFDEVDKIKTGLNGNPHAVQKFMDKHGISNLQEGLRLMESLQFQIMLPWGKAKVFNKMIDELEVRKADGEKIDIEMAKVEYGKLVDDMFSGQNWDVKLAESNFLNKELIQKGGPLMLFATDFLFTKMHQIGRVLKAPGEIFDTQSIRGEIARKAIVGRSIMYFGMLQSLSYGVNGHSTLENPNGSWWMLKMGDKTDAQGNSYYLNLFGISGQAMNLLTAPISSIQYQLSIPVGGFLGWVKPSEFESEEPLSQILSKQVTPMSMHGMIDAGFMQWSDNYASYGTMGFGDTIQTTALEFLGVEGKPIRYDETKMKVSDAFFDSDELTPMRSMSTIEKFIGGLTGKKIPDEYAVNGLEGGSVFNYVKDAVENGKMDNLMKAIEDKKDIARSKADKLGTTYKEPNLSATYSKVLGAISNQRLKNGFLEKQAIKYAIKEFKQKFPGEKVPKYTTIRDNMLRYAIGSNLTGEPFKVVEGIVKELGLRSFMSMSTKDLDRVLKPYRDAGEITTKQYSSLKKAIIEFNK